MLRTILYFAYFWILMTFFILFYIINQILILIRNRRLLRKFIIFEQRIWAHSLLWIVGAKMEVVGLENIPEHDNVCFVSNHQSYIDVMLILANMPKRVGFVGKKELRWVPIFGNLAKQVGCVFINRKDREQAVALIAQRLVDVKKGNPLLIFPEGTRSKSDKMNKFKVNGLLTILNADLIVVPLSVSGTSKCYEQHGRITPGKIKLVVHPAIETEKLAQSERDNFVEYIEQIVQSGIVV